MNALNKRFFAWIALIFLAFSAISFEIKNLIFFPVFVIFVVAFGFILSKNRNKVKNLKLICILLVGAALLGVICPRVLVAKNDISESVYCGEHNINGYVSEVSSSQNFLSEYVVHIEKLDGKRVSFDMVLVTDYKSDLVRGDFFKLRGRISALEDYKDLKYLRNKNTYDYPLICSIDEKTQIEFCKQEFRIPLMFSDLNSRLSSTLKAILGKDNGSLASALLLGNRELLSDNTLRDFKRAGVYHMLALSGLHVAILIGIFDWLLKKLYVVRNARIGLLVLLSLFYIALTGFVLSACRSIIMLWVMYIALILGKRRDAMTSLFIAVSVIVFIRPSSVLDIGLQLSFLSTFGVISASIISEKIKWFNKDFGTKGIIAVLIKGLRKLALLMLASLCVFILTLPIIMEYFGEVSLASFISNLFMGIVCEIFMIFSLLALIFSQSTYLRVPFAEISVRVGELMTDICSSISDMDGVMLSLSHTGTKLLVWGLFIGFLLLFLLRVSKKWLIFVPGVLFLILVPINIAIYGASREGNVRAEYLAGDSLVLSSADEVYICDMSDGSYGILYESIAVAKENCFTEIDGIILTHYHSNHIISLERLSKNYKIGSVMLPRPQNGEEDLIMRSIIRVLSDEKVNVYIYENDRELDILSGKLSVSPRAYLAGYEQPSVALSFAYRNERITLLSKPYFETYLEKSGIFKKYIENSEYLVFGSDGKSPSEDFEIFSSLQKGCEVSFSDFDLMNRSDFENYIDQYKIYFNVEYKKYDLK